MIIMNNIKGIFILATIIILVLYGFISENAREITYKNKLEQQEKARQEEFDITHETTQYNQYSIKNIEHEEMAKIYYNDYKNMIINYQNEAYSLIINKEDISKEDFLNYRNQLLQDYYNYNYLTYSYYQEQTTGNFVYRVTNNKKETFTFKTHAVMNYEVDITLQ